MKKTLVVILAIATGVLMFYFLMPRDYTGKSIKLANEINEFLVKKGVTDSNITKQYRKETKESGSKWIEFHKHLNIEFPDGWHDELKGIAVKHGCKIDKIVSPAFSKVIIRIDKKIFSELVFLPTLSKPKNRVAVVIDDLGYTDDIDDFLSLPIPLTYAILPGERYSTKIAATLKDKGIDFLLHFPMEPEDPLVNPGKRAIFLRMSDQEIKDMFNRNIESVPGAFGVSNHMGSAFSKSMERMKFFLSLVKERGLVYFDSYTTPKSQAKNAAVSLGMKVLQNRLFLDMEQSDDAIEEKIRQTLKIAKKNKDTIVIGHISHKNLPKILRKHLEDFRKNNIEFVSLKTLYEDTGD